MNLKIENHDTIRSIVIDRPEARNAIDKKTSIELAEAFVEFDADNNFDVAVLSGSGGHFCAGADLKAVSGGDGLNLTPDGSGPLGPTRMMLRKPVIAAVSGYAVAGGLELALWCDMRIVEQSATFGVFCRRWGVPLIDGGTIRLPRLIGQSRALDMILTGRPVGANEALQFGLANRVVDDGSGQEEAIKIAKQIAEFPQNCLRSDRLSAYQQFDKNLPDAIAQEFKLGMQTISSGETATGAQKFAQGAGRHGSFD